MLDAQIGRNALALMRTPSLPPSEAILTILLNEIAAFPDCFALVLDDYHAIDAKPIDAALTFLLEHLPRQMHLVITSREDPNLPLARLRARDQLTELRAADLRFTPAEAADFLNQTMGLNLSAEDIAVLETRTEGWIAGLQLAALSVRGREDAQGFIKAFAGDNQYIVDYLAEEVLQRQSEHVRIFLLQTSILDWLSGPLCDAVTDQKDSNALLVALERDNLFVSPQDDKRHWFRYHQLFADVLRVHLMAEQPDQVPALHRRASEWYEQNGLKIESFQHAVAARDFNRAAGVAETAWESMNESFQSATWLGWVKQLPEELIRSRPVLCTQIAWGLMDAHEVDASEFRLRDAERCLQGPPDEMIIVDTEQFRSLRARIAFARAYNAQTRRDFLSTIKYAELVLKLIPEENHFLRAQTTAILGATYLINGDLEAACQSMNDWIDSSLKAGNYFSAFAYAMAEKADIQTAQGHLREALRTYQHSLELAAEHDSGVLRVMAHHYLGMAMLYRETGNDAAADQHFQKSVELSRLHMSVDWSYRRCIAQARLKESTGELAAAIDLLDEAKLFYIKTLIPHTRPIDAMKAKIYLKQGRLFKAEEWVNEHKLSVDDELIYLREFEHIILARVLLAEYQRDRDERIILEGLTLLERLLKSAEDGNRMGSVLEILVVQALAYRAQERTFQACTSLERALTLAEPEGYVRLFVDEGEPMRLLISDCRVLIEKRKRGQDHSLIGYINRLLAAYVRPEDVQSTVNHQYSTMIEPLSERELEVLKLLGSELNGPEIARQLMVSLSTLRTHTQNIYSKLGVNNRRAAVRRAEELDLL
jgi:LuxR family maltose regulon positive regulatory protein